MLQIPTDDRVALVDGDGAHTYADLDRASAGVATSLLGGRRDLEDARVAFLAGGFGHAAVQRGIWRAGGVAVPLCSLHPAAELEFVLRDSGAECAISGAPGTGPLDTAAASAGTPVRLAGDLIRSPSTSALPDVAADRRAMIVYTSGTTGRPKGVVTTHGRLEAQVEMLVSAWGWTGGDRILHVLPLHHVHGIVNALLCPLRAGGVCEIEPRFDADRVWQRFASGEITVFTAVPSIYQRLIVAWEAADAPTRVTWSDGARRLRLMMSGSAALPRQVLHRWHAITGQTLLERYGMTELGMALSNPLDGPRRPGFVGGPLPGVELRLVDETGAPVEPGTAGDIEVRGPGVFLEYWQRPEETMQAFRDGWFQTGDTAVHEDGAYRILGRTNADILKTGGYKVSALEIESVLRDHPAVADCAVVGIPDEAWGERVSVAVELRQGAALSLEELRGWAASRLAPYKIPKSLHVVDGLPRNALGKVLKTAIVPLFGAQPS